jgi:hypothetical protein
MAPLRHSGESIRKSLASAMHASFHRRGLDECRDRGQVAGEA